MTLTLKELEAVAEELSQALVASVFRLARPLASDEVLLAFSTPSGEERRLLICVRPRFARIHLTERPVPKDCKKSNAFVVSLRSIRGAKVTSLYTRFNDRVICIDFAHVKRRLLFECSGHHPNLFLLDFDDTIIASLVPSRSKLRDLRPGRRYQRPIPHPSSRMEAIRFLPGPKETFSSLVEAWYERLATEEAKVVEKAQAERSRRKEIERIERLIAKLMKDLERQREAGALLEEGKVSGQRAERAKRLASRASVTASRITRLKRKLERLRSEEEG